MVTAMLMNITLISFILVKSTRYLILTAIMLTVMTSGFRTGLGIFFSRVLPFIMAQRFLKGTVTQFLLFPLDKRGMSLKAGS